MGTEESLERLGLGVAELREFGCDVAHGAMVLAELGTALGIMSNRCVAVVRQSLGKHIEPVER